MFEEMRLLHARRVAVDGHAVKGDGTRSRDPHSTANAIEILSAEIGRVGIAVVQSTNICHVERWRISLKAPVKYTQQQARRDGSWLSSGSLPRIASFKAREPVSARCVGVMFQSAQRMKGVFIILVQSLTSPILLRLTPEGPME